MTFLQKFFTREEAGRPVRDRQRLSITTSLNSSQKCLFPRNVHCTRNWCTLPFLPPLSPLPPSLPPLPSPPYLPTYLPLPSLPPSLPPYRSPPSLPPSLPSPPLPSPPLPSLPTVSAAGVRVAGGAGIRGWGHDALLPHPLLKREVHTQLALLQGHTHTERERERDNVMWMSILCLMCKGLITHSKYKVHVFTSIYTV